MAKFLENMIHKFRHRKDTGLEWLDICKDLDKKNRIDDLRTFIFQHVNSSNLPDVVKSFEKYTGSPNDLNEFHIHVLTLKKRELCIALGKYFENKAW
jgi:hypothetical protein